MIDRITLSGLAMALPLAAVSFWVFDGVEALVSCLLAFLMLAIAVSDARSFIVPDWLSLPAIPLGLVATGLTAAAPDPDTAVLAHAGAALIAGLAFFAIARGYRVLRSHDGLGLGDVKLAAAAGAWTGPAGVTLVVLVASLGALGFALCQALTRRGIDRRTMIPFGAFLAPAIWLVWSALQVAGA